MTDWLFQVSASLAASVVFKLIVLPLLMTTAFGGVLRFAFNKLKKGKEIIAFGVGTTLLFAAVIAIAGHQDQPKLNGTIQNVVSGQVPGSDRDTLAFFTVNITNTGSMQTIVKNWKVVARKDGRAYVASFPQMPPTFTFNNIPRTSPNQPESVTFKGEDNVLEKSLVPIQIGSIVTGIIFVVFENVDSSVFKSGADYQVTFEDVFSKDYSMSILSSGKIDLVSTYPGVHTELVCPVPPGGLPKLGNDITSKVPSAPIARP